MHNYNFGNFANQVHEFMHSKNFLENLASKDICEESKIKILLN